MNVASSLFNNETSGILGTIREEDASKPRAERLSLNALLSREQTARHTTASADSVTISETAMLLAAGLLNPAALAADESHQESATDATGIFSDASSFAQAKMLAQRARRAAALAGLSLTAPLPPSGNRSGDADKGPLNNAGSSSEAGFAIARLQNRLRNLQQELSLIEGGSLPDTIKAVQTHNLTSHINRTMQDISSLLQQSQS
jgi:hypothetical protein